MTRHATTRQHVSKNSFQFYGRKNFIFYQFRIKFCLSKFSESHEKTEMGSACSNSNARTDKSQLPKGTVIDPGRLDQPEFGSLPSSAHLTKVFERFAVTNKSQLNLEELTNLMSSTRKMYEKNKPDMVKKLNAPTYDKTFYALVLFALDDDSSNTIEVNEWKRWITRGASMDAKKREAWASKDINNLRLDFFLRSILDACGTPADTKISFDTW